jgi:hypothetical protein
MIQVTKEQHDSLAGEENPKVIDPATKTEYVLVRADLYEQLRSLVDDDFHVSDAYPAVARAVAPLWEDPKMDDYDRYEELKK